MEKFNTEEYLNSLKKEYEKTDASWHLKMSGWLELQKMIDPIGTRKSGRWFKFAATFAVITLFIIGLFGTYGVALASMPGDALYPVKLLSEKIIQKASGNNQIVIDHRAEEIVGLSKKEEVDNNDLKQVVNEYKDNVDQAKTGKPSINFQHKLDEQHSEFDKIGSDHPEIQKEIKDAVEASSREYSRSDD